MAKLKTTPIGKAELVEYLQTSSDFAFELCCLARLLGMGFQCQHGGSYTDPVTKKSRQFDIRALMADGPRRVRCAVECKNLSESFPLLVMRVPRLPEESFHHLILSYCRGFAEQSGPVVPAFANICRTVPVRGSDSEYVGGDPVGKSCAQVGRANHDDSIVANDADIYEKWSQALASAYDLADEAAQEGEKQATVVLTLILPVLVVPDGTLWTIDYQADGTSAGDPAQTDRCSFFVGRDYCAGSFLQGTSLSISHLEFVTLAGLDALMKTIAQPLNRWFPDDAWERAASLLAGEE